MTRLFANDIGHEPNLEPPTEPVPICPVCGAEIVPKEMAVRNED